MAIILYDDLVFGTVSDAMWNVDQVGSSATVDVVGQVGHIATVNLCKANGKRNIVSRNPSYKKINEIRTFLVVALAIHLYNTYR